MLKMLDYKPIKPKSPLITSYDFSQHKIVLKVNAIKAKSAKKPSFLEGNGNHPYLRVALNGISR